MFSALYFTGSTPKTRGRALGMWALALAVLPWNAASTAFAAAGDRPTAEVQSLLRVSREQPRVLADHRMHSVVDEPAYTSFQRTQMAPVKSRMVLQAVLSDPRISALPTVREGTKGTDPVEWLTSQIKVDFLLNSEILQISMSGDRPEDLEKVVNAVTDSYLKLVIDQDAADRQQRYGRLVKLSYSYQQELKDKRKQIRAFLRSKGFEAARNGKVDEAHMSRKIAELNQQLADIKRDLLRNRRESAAARSKLDRHKNSRTDEERTAVAVLEETIAVLEGREKVLKEDERELRQTAQEMSDRSENVLELEGEQMELEVMSERAREILSELEVSKIELEAPHRIQVIQRAVASAQAR
jgi:hypothetical protein